MTRPRQGAIATNVFTIPPARRAIPVALLSYALGSVSTGYHLVRLMTGSDVRHGGSGSSGARNVGRTLGRWGFVATMIGDIAKGAAAPAAARAIGGGPLCTGIAGVAVVAGHVWPVYLRFRGGRGLTTAFGAGLVIEPRVTCAALAIAAGLAPVTRGFTAAGIAGTFSAPLMAIAMRSGPPRVAAIAGMATIVGVGHRTHLRRFVAARPLSRKADMA